MEQNSYSLPKPLEEALEERAQEIKLSKGEIVRTALIKHLEV
mgnify:FL=1